MKDGKHTLSFELTDLAGNVRAVRRTVQLRAYDRAGNVRYSPKRTYRR